MIYLLFRCVIFDLNVHQFFLIENSLIHCINNYVNLIYRIYYKKHISHEDGDIYIEIITLLEKKLYILSLIST